MDSDQLVEYVEKKEYDAMTLLAHDLANKRDALCKALELIEDRFVDGENTYDDWLYMGATARQALAKIKNHLK